MTALLHALYCIIAATWETVILGRKPSFEPINPTEDTP